ncbi:hypothetical protein CWE12_01580 [Aliidiomarina sedimenti]|uniref:Competence protein ComEA n=1 Tax=Aliidiomarina sedimenti TaxID=1933879 RepID=A0ABY0C1H2_9GAMM|nr:ComEA family DNA-binding protein [Aliidiomarina sedimenti]RUO31716.1 hypothetical protein CWE12_01580 [Aliidiomarina sedimenti]
MLYKTLMFASLLTPMAFTAPALAEPWQPAQAQAEAAQQAKVNINHASAEQLAQALRGVGMARAQAIIELRERLGGFTEIEQLLQVKGLGIRTLENNKDKIEL